MNKVQGWKFPIDVDETTGKIITVEGNEDIKQSVKIILQTQKFERKNRPNFGTDINSFMFENIDYTLINNMAKEINRSIKKWEKHIDKLSVSVSQPEDKLATVDVDVSFITDILPAKEKVKESFSQDSIKR